MGGSFLNTAVALRLAGIALLVGGAEGVLFASLVFFLFLSLIKPFIS